MLGKRTGILVGVAAVAIGLGFGWASVPGLADFARAPASSSQAMTAGSLPVPSGVEAVGGGTTTTISVPGPLLAGVAVDPSTDTVYATNFLTNTVSVIDGETDTVTGTISVGSEPGAIAVDPLTNMVYVANWNTGNVWVINGETNTATRVIDLGVSPSGVAVDPSTHMVYVVDDNYVSVINEETDTVTGTLYPTGDDLMGVAVDPLTDMVYVTSYETSYAPNSVSVVNGATGDVTATIDLGFNPQSIAVDPLTDMVYVADGAPNSVLVINGATNTVTGTIGVGSDPRSVAVDPLTDTVYVTNYLSGTVSVIDGATNTVTGTISVGSNPSGLAVDPSTGTVYAADVSSTMWAITPSTTVTWTDSSSSSAIASTCEVLGASSSSGPWTEVTTAPCSSGRVTFDGLWPYWKVVSRLNDWEAASAPVAAS